LSEGCDSACPFSFQGIRLIRSASAIATARPAALVLSALAFMMAAKMDLQTFRDSIAKPQPPAGLSAALQALWWDAKGDWNKAHECAQEHDDTAGMHVHAYLHRKEGDQSNAEYWYRRCGATPSTLTLDAEWEELAQAHLEQD
jgi:hypothetical protein